MSRPSLYFIVCCLNFKKKSNKAETGYTSFFSVLQPLLLWKLIKACFIFCSVTASPFCNHAKTVFIKSFTFRYCLFWGRLGRIFKNPCQTVWHDSNLILVEPEQLACKTYVTFVYSNLCDNNLLIGYYKQPNI